MGLTVYTLVTNTNAVNILFVNQVLMLGCFKIKKMHAATLTADVLFFWAKIKFKI